MLEFLKISYLLMKGLYLDGYVLLSLFLISFYQMYIPGSIVYFFMFGYEDFVLI